MTTDHAFGGSRMKHGAWRAKGFTLVETLVSLAIIGMLLVVLMSMTNQVTSVWRYTSGRIDQFQKGREAFESITRRLSMATLNTYLDYNDPANPTSYVRQSELRFLSGRMDDIAGNPPSGKTWTTHGLFFQAPLGASEPGEDQLKGLYSLLSTWGYFVEFGDDLSSRPGILTEAILPARYRFRLYEMIQPASDLSIYTYTSGPDGSTPPKPKNASYKGRDWFTTAIGQTGPTRPVHVLAENVIALVLLPKLSSAEDIAGADLSPDYKYDSTDTNSDPRINPKNQLPPIVQVTMVVVDEASAKRLEQGSAMPGALNMNGFFSDATAYKKDMADLEKNLRDNRIQYRIFSTNVQIKGAKWSQEQKN